MDLEYGPVLALVLAGEHDDRVTLLDLCSAITAPPEPAR
jgi:hypothetical protein